MEHIRGDKLYVNVNGKIGTISLYDTVEEKKPIMKLLIKNGKLYGKRHEDENEYAYIADVIDPVIVKFDDEDKDALEN